ncbi:hypothetical protein MS3_00000195 [Schistosoma haematobium]|uniref:Uncharacterized protein n=1 Tax=Schistosoma haematobium TaxID=6185 RepID=A0A922LGW8_SCHHA|nr:hypothetical protein MS3_00000195 [Schistosoma haematobium]KAH9584374.1 hypothetical protein MS3_00000195 [Schistosoma haematobium]
MTFMILDISCRSNYFTGDAAIYAWSHIREMQANYRRQYPQVYLTSPELIACFQEIVKDYKKMKTDHSETICNEWIPYRTNGIREIDQIIRWKYYDVEELNIKFFNHRFLSQTIKLTSEYSK